ncbi:hypothetical protein BKA70DRAFT_1563113, partial [Coprinopsis sp. MPI-PUGE-AT-0042]
MVDCVYSSQSTVTTLLEVWAYHPTDANHGFKAAPTDATADALEKCLIHCSGQVNFLDAMVQSKTASANFCAGLERRITQFELLASNAETTENMLEALRGILMVSFGVTGVSTQIRSTMHSLGYVRKIGALVVEFHPRIRAAIIFDVWYYLVALAFQHGTVGIGQLLDAGFLPLFVRDMAKPNRVLGKDQDVIFSVLGKLMAMNHTPRCLLDLHHRIQAFAPEISFSNQRASETAWNGLVKNVAYSLKHLKALEKQGQGKLSTKLCDFNMHHEMQASLCRTTDFNPLSTTLEESKCCSGCRVVVYCSTACQNEDWKKRHHKECSSMSRLHLDLKTSGAYYSNKTRYFNIEAGRMSVSQKMPGFDMCMVHRFPGNSRREMIVNFDVLERPSCLLGGQIHLE